MVEVVGPWCYRGWGRVLRESDASKKVTPMNCHRNGESWTRSGAGRGSKCGIGREIAAISSRVLEGRRLSSEGWLPRPDSSITPARARPRNYQFKARDGVTTSA